MAFLDKITQNVFPLYSDRFVYLLSIKFTFIAVTYLVFKYFVGICKNCIFQIFLCYTFSVILVVVMENVGFFIKKELQCFQMMLYLSYLVAIFVCCHGNGGLAKKIVNIFFTQKNPLYS